MRPQIVPLGGIGSKIILGALGALCPHFSKPFAVALQVVVALRQAGDNLAQQFTQRRIFVQAIKHPTAFRIAQHQTGIGQ